MFRSNCLANLSIAVACTLPQQEVSLVINMVVSVYEKHCLCM